VAQLEQDILADAGELSAGAMKLAEILSRLYPSILVAQLYRLKRLERATSPVRIRRGRGLDQLAMMRTAWNAATEDERQRFLLERDVELKALATDSDKFLLWQIGVFERGVKALGLRPERADKLPSLSDYLASRTAGNAPSPASAPETAPADPDHTVPVSPESTR